MTLTQLEYIIAIADHGSFVEAAKQCFVTQPALTTQIKNLENELDVVLFDRTKKPIIPTEIGAQIIEQGREVIMQSRKIPDIVSEYNSDVKGDLRIGIIPTIAPYLIPLFVNEFNREHSQVNLHVSEEITEDVLSKLKTGDLDVGIVATPVSAKGIVFLPMYYERFYGFVSPSHPNYYRDELEPEHLAIEDLWLLKEGNCFRNQVINICNANQETDFQHHFRYESHSIESLKRIVEVKQGMTFIPELASLDVVPNKRDMVKKISSEPVREVSIAVSRQFLKKRLIDNLKHTIEDGVPSSMRQKPDSFIVDTNIRL